METFMSSTLQKVVQKISLVVNHCKDGIYQYRLKWKDKFYNLGLLINPDFVCFYEIVPGLIPFFLIKISIFSKILQQLLKFWNTLLSYRTI